MKYLAAWVWCGVLGVVIDLIRHRKDISEERRAGIRWNLFEVVSLAVAAIFGGPWLIVGPLLRRGDP